MTASAIPENAGQPATDPEQSSMDSSSGVAVEPDDGQSPAELGVDWDHLPPALRVRLAELSAAVLDELPAKDIPTTLRSVARFAPIKRAKLGAAQLIAALREVPSFRAYVVTSMAKQELDTNDVVASAAAALLKQDSTALPLIALISARAGENRYRAERDVATAKVERLTAEITQLQADMAVTQAAVAAVREELQGELNQLRKRLREQGSRLRAAKDEAEQARADLAQALAEVEERIGTAVSERDKAWRAVEVEQNKTRQAREEADIARQAVREARQADEVRLALLMDTLSGAVSGLRRELAITGSGPRPADGISGATEGATVLSNGAMDVAALDRLLALPSAHLIVDGYNVTKTGYPELTLFEQRERLIGQLGALVARLSIEVTLVFDGAAVVTTPSAPPRGVRVLFSDPGVLADDVIRNLVAVEPVGRPIIVVTADREIIDAVRQRGAYTAPSTVLLARFNRV